MHAFVRTVIHNESLDSGPCIGIAIIVINKNARLSAPRNLRRKISNEVSDTEFPCIIVRVAIKVIKLGIGVRDHAIMVPQITLTNQIRD